MAWGRGRHERGEDGRQAGLSIEFDDEDLETDPDSAAHRAPTEPVLAELGTAAAAAADSEGSIPDAPASESEVVSGRAASRWSRIPRRYRVTAVTAALVLAVGSVAAVRLDQTAQRRAAEEFTLAVVNDRYQPAISEVGLDLGLTLVNHGPALVTVLFLQVSQPGLRLVFYPVAVTLPVGKPTALTLVGVFDCRRTAPAHASTVEVTVSGQTGISSVTLELKPDAVPPDGWQVQRSTFCSSSSQGSTH